MSNYDYQEALNARAEQNRETEAQRLRMAEEAERLHQVTAHAQDRRRALKALLIRLAAALTLAAALYAAMRSDLMAPVLVIPLQIILLGWICTWFGAWLQFTGRRLPV